MSYDRSQPITERGQVNLAELARLAERAAGPVPYSTESGFYQSAIGNVMDTSSGGSSSAASAVCVSGVLSAALFAAGSGVLTDLTWGTTDYNDGGWTLDGTSKLWTVPADGLYLITLEVWWQDNGTGIREHIQYDSDGGFLVDTRAARAGTSFLEGAAMTLSGIRSYSAGATIGFQVYQTSGGSLNLDNTGDFHTRFTITQLVSGAV